MGQTSQQFLNQDCSTLANFKAWGSAISAFILSCSWTKTSDTGQVNWGTISSLPPQGTTVYEIWQPSSDPLQTGSTAYYLRVDYGTAGAGSPEIFPTIGFATNGAGSFIGNTAGGFTQGSFSNAKGVFPCNFSGDIDRLGISMWWNGNYPWHWSVERTKNTNGSNSTDGVFTYNTLNQNTLVFISQSATGNYGNMTVGCINANADRIFNNSVPVSPIIPTYGVEGNPITTICMVPQSDILAGGMFQTILYGATHTYMCLGNNGNSNQWNGLATCMRYD